MKRYTARGVVLNTVKYGDRGLIVQLLTSSHGRQSYMVQGVGSRGRGSKLALFQPMFALEFEGLESTKMQMLRLLPLKLLPIWVFCSSMAWLMVFGWRRRTFRQSRYTK